MKLFLAAAAFALTPSLALAQTVTATAPVSKAAPKAATAATVDPARLAVARRVVGKLMPDGIYETMFRETFSAPMDSMMGSANEKDRFFSTPAGGRYAAKSLMLFMSPELMASMEDMMPEMTRRMPDMMALVESATAEIPPARKLAKLDPKDRKRLAELLGVAEKDLVDPNETTELEQELENLN